VYDAAFNSYCNDRQTDRQTETDVQILLKSLKLMTAWFHSDNTFLSSHTHIKSRSLPAFTNTAGNNTNVLFCYKWLVQLTQMYNHVLYQVYTKQMECHENQTFGHTVGTHTFLRSFSLVIINSDGSLNRSEHSTFTCHSFTNRIKYTISENELVTF